MEQTNTNGIGIINESDEISESYVLIDKRFQELKFIPNLDSFRTNFRVLWRFNYMMAINNNFKVDNCSGDFLDLGNGSWMVAGTCSGTRHRGTPFSTNWSMEFDNSSKTIVWTVSSSTQRFDDVLNPNASVQLKIDINGNPQLIIVRGELLNFGDLGYRIERGSYLTII
jgi:hypothetical protein